MSEAAPIPQALTKLQLAVKETNSLACIGLDTKPGRLPQSLTRDRSPLISMLNFNRAIIKNTSDLVCAYKPNSAFYEAEGADGWDALEMTMNLISEETRALKILDAKRGDVKESSKAYAEAAFDRFGADAITVNGFSGSSMLTNGERVLGALEPFLDQKDKLTFVWDKSSNDDGGEWQDLAVPIVRQTKSWKRKFGSIDELADLVEETGVRDELRKAGYHDEDVPLSLLMAYKMSRDWNPNNNLGLVLGATHPREVGWVRKVVGDMTILVPGIGAQEGELAGTLRLGLNSKKEGVIISASRSIIFASNEEDFAQAARNATIALRDSINQYRQAA
ncbi:MAG: orotidine-5'-phosphate decarboxylase [Candidatus Roizmanbacteria bacterium]